MRNYKATCPVCDGSLTLTDIEVSEIISCAECKSRLVVNSLQSNRAKLSPAPNVEEDWGE